MRVYDFFTLDDDAGAKVRMTNDGYLVATPRVARTGIQLYYGSELGLTGDDAKKVMKVYRPEDEVFKTDSLATYGFKPVTDDHPPVAVNVGNWKDYAKGQIGGEVLRDQEFIRVPMALMDAGLVKKTKGGKVEISVGYDCEIDFTPGTTPDGAQFDAKQKNISVNHVAVVDAARGGAKLRFGDATASVPDTQVKVITPTPPVADGGTQQKELPAMKTILVDGISVAVETEQGGQIIDRHIASLKTTAADTAKKLDDATVQVTTLTKQLGDAVAKHTTELAAKDAEIVTLKKAAEDSKITPDKLDAMVKDRALTAGKARALLGDKVVVDGKTEAEIMRQVVDAKLGDAAKGWTDDQVKVSFATMTADVKPVTQAYDTTTALGTAFGGKPQGALSQDSQARIAERDKKLQAAWQGPAATA